MNILIAYNLLHQDLPLVAILRNQHSVQNIVQNKIDDRKL